MSDLTCLDICALTLIKWKGEVLALGNHFYYPDFSGSSFHLCGARTEKSRKWPCGFLEWWDDPRDIWPWLGGRKELPCSWHVDKQEKFEWLEARQVYMEGELCRNTSTRQTSATWTNGSGLMVQMLSPAFLLVWGNFCIRILDNLESVRVFSSVILSWCPFHMHCLKYSVV